MHQVVTADVQSAEAPLTLKHDDCFGLFNEIGDIDAEARSEAGLYRAGVRHLSRLTLTIAMPAAAAARIANTREDNVLLTLNLTNPDVRGEGGRIVLPRGTLHITRSRFIWSGVCHEMIRVRNFALHTVSAELVIRFGSDFENIVDVRAQRRVDAGRARFERVEKDSVTQGYLGADEVVRETVVDCHTAPEQISADSLRYRHADRQPRREDDRARDRLPVGGAARCRSRRSRARSRRRRSWRAARRGRRRRSNRPTDPSTPGCSARRPTSA